MSNTQLKQTVEGLERERDFYFSKLRDIELLLQQAVDADPEIEKADDGLVKHIQAILYSTEVRLGHPCFLFKNEAALMDTFFHRKDLRYLQRPKVEWWMIRRRSKEEFGSPFAGKVKKDTPKWDNGIGFIISLVKGVHVEMDEQ